MLLERVSRLDAGRYEAIPEKQRMKMRNILKNDEHPEKSMSMLMFG